MISGKRMHPSGTATTKEIPTAADHSITTTPVQTYAQNTSPARIRLIRPQPRTLKNGDR
jgi:hypothetical protein